MWLNPISSQFPQLCQTGCSQQFESVSDPNVTDDPDLCLFHMLFKSAKAPNQLKLRAERMKKIVLDRYRAKRKSFYRNKAVAQLWANGVDFDTALSIVGEAFDAVTYEA